MDERLTEAGKDAKIKTIKYNSGDSVRGTQRENFKINVLENEEETGWILFFWIQGAIILLNYIGLILIFVKRIGKEFCVIGASK